MLQLIDGLVEPVRTSFTIQSSVTEKLNLSADVQAESTDGEYVLPSSSETCTVTVPPSKLPERPICKSCSASALTTTAELSPFAENDPFANSDMIFSPKM